MSIEAIIWFSSLGTAITYTRYLDFLISYVEKIDESNTDNIRKKVNLAETEFMDPYYNPTTCIIMKYQIWQLMGNTVDVDNAHYTLQMLIGNEKWETMSKII